MKIQFSQQLSDLRKAAGLSQKELAVILHTSNSSVCDWERGRAQPDLQTLADIAAYFDVSVGYLLGLEDA